MESTIGFTRATLGLFFGGVLSIAVAAVGLAYVPDHRVIIIMLALIFEGLTGFHNVGNLVSTLKYSNAMSVKWAVVMCAFFNSLGGLLLGTAVATFVSGLVPVSHVTGQMLIVLLLAASFWNLFTWTQGIPVASSHCLLSALVGAGMANAYISGDSPLAGVNLAGLEKTLIWFGLTPIIGALFCFALVKLLAWRLGRGELGSSSMPARALKVFQIGSAAGVSFAEGGNNAQKAQGTLMLILVTQFHTGSIHHVETWVIWAASATIGLATLIGGLGAGRIMRTFGEGLSNKGIDSRQGAAAQFTAAVVVFLASLKGIPASTTQVQVGAAIGGTAGLHDMHSVQGGTAAKVGIGWLLTWIMPAGIAFGVLLLTFHTLHLA